MGEPDRGPVDHHPAVIVGGGLGGVAAAIALVRGGVSATLLEPSDQLGGQITRQAVAPLDEHALIETIGATASYRWLRDGIRDRYRRSAPPDASDDVWRNPGNGWVSRLCFEPQVGADVLDELLTPAIASGRLTIRFGHQVRAVGRRGSTIDLLDLDTPDGPRRISVGVVLDATELGDLLPLADAPWVTGAEAQHETGEALALDEAVPRRTQAITVCAVLRREPSPGPVLPAPAGYTRLRDTQPFTFDVPDAEGNPRRFGMYEPTPGGPPPFWTYRRLRDASRLGGVERSVINWPGNDYVGRDLVLAEDRDAVVDEARTLTRAFVHWLQTEAPRDDGGVGHPELQLDPVAAGTSDGLAAAPYIREARRLRARQVVTAEDVLPQPDRGARGRRFGDAVGVGWYPLDVHAAVGEPTSRNDPTVPFQVPMSSLIADSPDNLLAAGKAMGTTHLSNGAYRVHPVEWAVGEAAGTVAAAAIVAGQSPGALARTAESRLDVQRRLLAGGAELAWVTDVPVDDPRWASVQLLITAGAADGPRLRDHLDVEPDRRLDDADRDAAVAAFHRVRAAAGLPTVPTSARTFGELAVELDDDLPLVPPPGDPLASTTVPAATTDPIRRGLT